MIEQSLIKSNFLGRDGFRWWVGQIPPESSHGSQINESGWGNRFKVRIMGYHPYDEVELPNDDLPWAQVLIPTTAGTGAANNATSVKLSPGDVVFGFFLDGDNAQIPVIMGAFGRTSDVGTLPYSSPFQPFSGYTSKIKAPNGTLKADQSNESNSASQKSPRSVSPLLAKRIGPDEISYYYGIGDTVQLANTVNNTVVDKISAEVTNLLTKIQTGSSIFTNIASEVSRVTQKIQVIANGLIGNMINGLYKALAPIINQGLKLLYELVYNLVLAATGNPAAAHIAGVAAQNAMVIPVKAVQGMLKTIGGSIISGLGSTIANMLNSVIDNSQRFVSCAGVQFTGALVNDIISKATSGLSTVLNGIQSVLQFFPSFSVGNVLRNSTDAIKGLVGMLQPNQTKGKVKGMVKQWIIGQGPKGGSCYDFKDVLESANVMNASDSNVISSFNQFTNFAKTGEKTPIGSCFTGTPDTLPPPIINIFGGGGLDATAVPLFGSIVGEGLNKTGSIIGVQLTNPGYGYEFPPYVEILDEYGQGYGAIARSVLNDDGSIKYIYIVSEGENYPISEETEYVINNIVVQESGQGYESGDEVVDDLGNTYTIEVFNGSITKVTPLNNRVSDLPSITINSRTGSGAILRPILGFKDLSGDPIKSIDCVS